jgi:hypothetical protein
MRSAEIPTGWLIVTATLFGMYDSDSLEAFFEDLV